MKKALHSILLFLTTLSAFAQESVEMPYSGNLTVKKCGIKFYDTNGPNVGYYRSTNSYITFNPTSDTTPSC